MTACWSASRWSGAADTVWSQLDGSWTTAPAAASACWRKVAGSACTSLRRAALTSGVASDGPAIKNSARASSAVSPLRSVREPPTSSHPPPRPGCE